MDIYFRGLLSKLVVVYLDDVTIFFKVQVDRISHLRKIFERCQRYRISLNPKKSFCCVVQGKILIFVVSKEGMMIDPKRSAAISKLSRPHNKKLMQSFMAKINFV
jgi:hypothetical protein